MVTRAKGTTKLKTTLVITTYNWPEALRAVLNSVLCQSELPDEVIIADDGSKDETKTLINGYCQKFSIPLIHSWIPDNGFQLAKSRNQAIAKATGDYIVMVDGDMFLSNTFIQSHKHVAKSNQFVQGGRVLTDLASSQSIMNNNVLPSIFSNGIRNRHNCISNPLLSRIFSFNRNNDKSTRGCNMAFWHDDIIKVNGFNEEFVGWGREDSDFVHRMLNNNINRLYLKFAGIGYHFFHTENSRAALKKNDEILKNTITNKLESCTNGISKYLESTL